ncbi:hypothetical protein AALO_G00276290 [Alosa alosa]|uniref:Coiled-coil domain-containing protein 189 n=2 Tax=Alosa alosa TaxID=278164 RepID=A0AAV6FIA8_9TELE|nr:coiled-coil domain-containing protein 189 isoform X1 [Alosa alosa]KAG5262548.1 hypothetical protein AALO_G00276290 [Alosa alosa]
MDLKKAIMEPRSLKARILMWADATFKDMEDINKATSTEDLEKVLSSVFRIDSTDPKQRVLLELYINAVLFCRGKKLNREQTSTLLSIFKRVHQANTDTPLNNAEQCFNYCSELLLCHSVRRPPFSIGLYNLNQMTDILKYFTNTYMRHYTLYKYIFTPQMFLDLTLTYSGPAGDIDPKIGSPPESQEGENGSTGVNIEGNESGTDDKKTTDINSTQPVDNEQKDTELALDKTGAAKKLELQSLVQQEVKREMQLVSGHLEQRLKESTAQLNTILSSLETNVQTKK